LAGGEHLAFLDLLGADLAGADLAGADLAGAHHRGAHHRGAHHRGADLRNADFRGVAGDLSTQWPDGFDWRGAGVYSSGSAR